MANVGRPTDPIEWEPAMLESLPEELPGVSVTVEEPPKQEAEKKETKNKPEIVDLTKQSPPKPEFPYYKIFRFTFKTRNGSVWDGVFGLKRLSLGDAGKAGVRKAVLNEGQNVDAGTDMYHGAVAAMEYGFFQKPDWFKPLELYDDDLFWAVYTEVVKFEESFRSPVAG